MIFMPFADTSHPEHPSAGPGDAERGVTRMPRTGPDRVAPLPLDGVRVLSLAVNLPGPAAASRLHGLGARVTKVEPPSGDPLAAACRSYYDELVAGQDVVKLDLKGDAGSRTLWELLQDTELLLTSSRPRALHRLGLDWGTVHARLPRLSYVAIVGDPGAAGDLPGHDLTYQASAGILRPPGLPTVLVADLAGAERATAESCAVLLHAAHTGEGGYREVVLHDVADAMARPAHHGLTAPGGPLGGALPGYAVYEAATGFVAVAALEPHFWQDLVARLGVEGGRDDLARAFRRRSAEDWQVWAMEHGLPVVAVRAPKRP